MNNIQLHKKWSHTTRTNFVELETSSEAHKVMLNSPSCGARGSFVIVVYSKKNTHPLIFWDDGLFWSSQKWKCGDKFSCAHLSRIGAHSSKVSMLSKIFLVFRKNSQRYSVWENHPNTKTNNIWFEKYPNTNKIAWILLPIIFDFKKSPKYEYEY